MPVVLLNDSITLMLLSPAWRNVRSSLSVIPSMWLPAGTTARLGDVNGDGEVNISDVGTLIDIILGANNKA